MASSKSPPDDDSSSDESADHLDEDPARDGADTEIGYQKPPRANRWKKGRSGNPAGRKKGSKNKRTIIIKLMEQKLGRKIHDLSKLSRYEALLLKGIQKALTGDTRAMAFILRRYDDASNSQTSASVATERDEVVYAALVERIKCEVIEDD
jgi:hypothetical protein